MFSGEKFPPLETVVWTSPVLGVGVTLWDTLLKQTFFFSALSVPTTLTGVAAKTAEPGSVAPPGRGLREQPASQQHQPLLLHQQLAVKPDPAHQAGDSDPPGVLPDQLP